MATRAARLKPAPAASPWRPSEDRARQREIKRDAVILTAARAFRQRGYHNTSVDDLASILNVTKPTIYHYLQNKEEILFECFRTGLDQIRGAFDEIRGSHESGLARLTAVMRRYAQAISSEFGWCMVRAEDQDLSPVMSRRINALKKEIDQGLRRLIEEGIADGSIRRCDPKITAFALAGAMNWIAHWHRADAELTPEQIADRFIEVFVDGLMPRSREKMPVR